MYIKWYGTASIEIESNGQRLLFDPFVPVKGSEVETTLDDYDGFDTVLVTHGHFDHIGSLPAISKRNAEMQIYSTWTPYSTLVKKEVDARKLHLVQYDDELQFNDICVRVWHGKHAELPIHSIRKIAGVFKRRNLMNLSYLMKENKESPENDETVIYEVKAEGKMILVMGSMNLREEIDYPLGADILILPYNGWSDNYRAAIDVIKRLKPKRILLDHYDDSFPPLTSKISVKPILTRFPNRMEALKWKEALQI